MAYNKYSNQRTGTSASKKEHKRAVELGMLQMAGEISKLKSQVTFVLQEGFRHEGKAIRAITYIADFTYTENGIEIVEDVKGFKTEVYKIKRKLFIFNYPHKKFRET